MGWVPVIDIGDAAAAVGEVKSACEDLGFLAIVGHGVAESLIDETWAAARQFFDLALEAKMEVAMPRPGYPYGYSPISGESLAASLGHHGLPDLKESFAIGPVDRPTHEITDPDEEFAWSPNLWPAHVVGFRRVWETYFRELAALSGRLLSIMALALELPAGYFAPMIDRPTSAMRALNYPPKNTFERGEPTADRLGGGAHTDYGTLTVLLADPDEPGLQVEGANGEWLSVMGPPGGFVVNLGDAMARWTNDRWRSTMHRVLVPQRRRQSIAFFHNANWDAVIECLPSCLDPGERLKFSPIEAGPHLMQKFQSTVNTS